MATEREVAATKLAQDTVESLYRLVQLKEANAITEEEFLKLKKALLQGV